MMKKYILTLLLALPLLSSCYKDNGNYNYTNLPEITFEGVPSAVEVLSYQGRITVSPTITSSVDGVIRDGNPNYTVEYKLGKKGIGYIYDADGDRHVFLTLNPEGNIAIDVPANYTADTYICWLTVTDNRTGVATSQFFDVMISTTTYEGWIVLCEEGDQGRARVDMISKISSTNIATIHDIAKGLPVIHGVTQLGFHPTQASPGTRIHVLSKEGSYSLDANTLESDELNEFNLNNFLTAPGNGTETMLNFYSMSLLGDPWYMISYSFAISDAGNAYAMDYGTSGASFGLPVNTSVAGSNPEYKVAPFVGYSEVRPSNGTTALFYDTDNKRFVGWTSITPQSLSAIPDPTQGKRFSFDTGKDMIYMEGTRRSNGLVYAILQDTDGNRSIYAINMGGNGFVQEDYYENVNAPGFSEADQFAFHSQYPVMFYSTGNKVYLYHLGTRTSYDITGIVLNGMEEVTRLKFNLFKNSLLTNLNDQSDEFMNKQFQLICCTFDASGGVNGGRVAIYQLDAANNTVSKVEEYGGFAKVRDIAYRER